MPDGRGLTAIMTSQIGEEDGTMKRVFGAVGLVCLIAVGAVQAQQQQVPEAKQTVAGLYMTAKEAYEKWKSDPENVKIIDVRTPEEYVYVGHPAMAWNVPLKFIEHRWDEAKSKPVMRMNEDFVTRIKEIVKSSDTILVTCRSGNRSTPAVNLLAEAGFENVFNVIDGVEGDKVKDPENVFSGKRMKNGWKNSGLPWTYDLDPKLMWLETDK
jgi:rhodanese-related sulfurtransferase